MGQNPNDPESERRIARRRERRRQAALRKARGRRRRDGWGGDGAPGVSVPLGLLELDPDRIPPLGPLGEVGAVGPTAYYARKVPYAFVSAASDHPLARRKPRVYTVRFPEVFSFIDAPEDALRLIERAVVAFARSPTRRVSIDQARCRQIDYGAASVLCALALDAERRYGVRLTGTYPRDARAREIVEATGLPKLLGLVEDTPAHFLSFELQCGRRGRRGASAASDRDRIATAFVEHLDECLQAYAVELSPDGKHYVSQLFTEAIGNAEDHGGRQEWWVGGYLRRPPGSAVGDLNVTIFNLGNTVYQTLAQLPPSSTLGVRLRGIVKRHRDAGAYGPAYSEEETWTLGAIQEGGQPGQRPGRGARAPGDGHVPHGRDVPAHLPPGRRPVPAEDGGRVGAVADRI